MSQPDRMAFRSSAPPSPEEELAQFQALQEDLVHRWARLRDIDSGPRDVVVVPSLSIPGLEFASVAGVTHYEERMLFTLMLLKHPRTRLVYVTSQPLPEITVGYMLGLLQGIPTSHARQRLTLLSVHDTSSRPLTQKLLERPRLLERIRRVIDPARAHMTCFTVSPAERSLAVRLGIPLYGVDPELLPHGTKTGSRRLFREAGVRMPSGREGLHKESEVAETIVDLIDEQPTLRRVVIKLDIGYTGQGNGVLDLSAVPHAYTGSRQHRLEVIHEALPSTRLGSTSETWDTFRRKLGEMGGVVECFVEGRRTRSPSGQIRINPRGELESMSTHDQIVGGPDGQIYEGCRFPADEAYRREVQDSALQVGRVLAQKGIIGRIGVDFITVERAEQPGAWDHYAIEINMRMTGTTHPLMLMRMLNDGRYDPASGLYLTRRGDARYYVATDTLRNPAYRGLLVEDLLDIAAVHDLHYKPWTDEGVVFHLTGALSQFGKLGFTAIGASPEHADRLYTATRETLDIETRASRGAVEP